MNVYCPPAHPTDFLTKIIFEFSTMNSAHSIVGGDFNCILNPIMDRFPPKISPLSLQAKSLNAVCRDLGFVDVWRFLHPLSREFTYFSAPHGCHTRIYYLFIPRTSLDIISNSCIGKIVISDHACVTITVNLKGDFGQIRHWRFNSTILKDNNFTSYFRNEIRFFFI